MTDFKLLIGGELVPGADTLDVINPATGSSFAKGPRASLEQLNAAVAAAKTAFPAWRARPIPERQKVLAAIAEHILQHAPDLARLLTQEQGKPLADARAEVDRTAMYFTHYARLDANTSGLADHKNGNITIQHVPLGVVAAIVPWNFPLALMAFKVPAALLAGNTVVLKPAATTPLTTLKLAELISDLVPAGVLNVIADNNDLGAALSTHPDVRKISFTGSTATGAKVMAAAAADLKRVTLELGGNDAGIVLDDADPDAVAPQLFRAAFRNSGQVCIALKRLYVHESIYDRMCDAMAALSNAAIVGDGLEQGTEFGPVQNKAQYEKVASLVAQAQSYGQVVAGGIVEGNGYFIRPTIVRDAADGEQLVDDEQFGPILPLIRFSDPEDAIAKANASNYGLGGSIWSSDLNRAYALANKMDSGTVWINKHGELSPTVPFGGAKQSGIGIELGQEGLLEFTQLKVLNSAS